MQTASAKANVVPIARSVATDPGYLSDLAHEINVCLKKADDYRLTVSLKLAEAKAACKKAKVPFKSWVNRNIEIGYFEATRLAKIGGSEQPAKALADLRKQGARRESKRANKKKAIEKQTKKIASDDATPSHHEARDTYLAWLKKQPKEVRVKEVRFIFDETNVGIRDFCTTVGALKHEGGRSK